MEESRKKQIEKTIMSGFGKGFIENDIIRNALVTGFDLVRHDDCGKSDQAARECVINVTKKFTLEALKQ